MTDPKRMADPDCKTCNGLGFYFKGEGENTQALTCRCRWIHQVRAYLDRLDELAGVKTVQGPLVADHKPFRGSAVIQCGWDAFLGHLRGWLAMSLLQGQEPRVLTTSISLVRTRYTGIEPGQRRSGGSLLEDHLGGHDLVVLRMWPTRNPLNSTALLETVSLLPTLKSRLWLVHEPGARLEKGHPSWSDELGAVIQRWPKFEIEKATDVDVNDFTKGVTS